MLLENFSEIVDFRRAQGKMYELKTILHFATLAKLSGASSYRKMHTFIVQKFSDLKLEFNLKWKNPPSYSVLRYIIIGTNTHSMHKALKKDALEKLNEMVKKEDLLVLSADGKVVLNSYDHYKGVKAIQDLSIYSIEHNIILAIEKIDEKTNEIPTAQKIIPELGITGAIFTFDAMNCQFKTLDILNASGNDTVVQVKGNQENLLNDCKKIAEFSEPIEECTEGLEKGHGRITDRKVSVYNPELIAQSDGKWNKVKAIIKVERLRQIFNTKKKLMKTIRAFRFISQQRCFQQRNLIR